MKPFQIFISYRQDDLEFVGPLLNGLRNSTAYAIHTPYLDSFDQLPLKEQESRIRACSLILVLVSDIHSLELSWLHQISFAQTLSKPILLASQTPLEQYELHALLDSVEFFL